MRPFTTNEAAEFLRCSPGHLRNLRTQNKGPVYIRIGARVLYRRQDLMKYIKDHAVNPKEVQDAS